MIILIVDRRFGEKLDLRDFIHVTHEVRELSKEPVNSLLNLVYSIKYPFDMNGRLDDTHKLNAFVGIGVMGAGIFRKTIVKRSDFWQYPHETLNLGYGDCEDTAILLGALLEAKEEPYYIAIGIVSFNNKFIGYHVWVIWNNMLIETTLDESPSSEIIVEDVLKPVIHNGIEYNPSILFNANEVKVLKDNMPMGLSSFMEKAKITRIKHGFR